MLTPSQSAQPSSAPLVSMLVICYNQSRFVVETLESVKAQTYKNTELIIADDCSTDDSVAVIERWLSENKIQCTFIRHQKNQGVCKTLNDALAVATGKYISMIACDDLWLPNKIERQTAIMESQPESVGVLYSDAYRIGQLSEAIQGLYILAYNPHLLEIPPPRVLDALLQHNFIPGMTTLIRRNCYDVVGLYDESIPSEDWDMWLRIARHYSFLYCPTPLARYRIHEDSFSRSSPLSMAIATVQVFAKQVGLGGLDEAQNSTVRNSLAAYSQSLPALYLQEANLTRLRGDRASTRKHLIACLHSGGLRQLSRQFFLCTSLLMYVLFGVRRLRWWKNFEPPLHGTGSLDSAKLQAKE